MQLLEIGRQVEKRRTELQLTQAQLARMAGLSRLTINQLESGRIKDLGVAKLMTLLALLGLELNLQPHASQRGLFKATVAANVSYEGQLTQERLAEALASGAIPRGYEPHVSAILDEAPLPLVVKAVEEAATQTGVAPKRIWKHLSHWSRTLHLYRTVWQ
ncbi:helix-turn-helix transcriptional regulator [Noviherbaspirillum pedocola]|uniref:Helix-turn-helix domain-containing protein n=1 Tax=Noviherbaspirillum pedocola TaxID=2801341 RepID=A0A934SQP7_9BURK|nr:helix-turn-helix domain-containing protein [Noviherbaspirillum pedocola]MBK4734835.1 helix-turn-helix domain-containing protein [Noviherbaspirillum pedocola]